MSCVSGCMVIFNLVIYLSSALLKYKLLTRHSVPRADRQDITFIILSDQILQHIISNLVNSLVPYLNSTVSCVAHILPDSKKRLQARAQNHKIGLFRRQIGEQNAVSFLRQLSVAHVEGQAKVFIFLSGLIISIKVIVSKFYGYITNPCCRMLQKKVPSKILVLGIGNL